MRISLITGLNNESPVESCIRDLTQVRDAGFARLWVTQMPYDVDLLTVLAAYGIGCMAHQVWRWRQLRRARRRQGY